ncbi:glutamate 5-kinase [Chengkuizengella axinellae]|uniref:Glutamate 5-kinase n=1 Tax=Chengkuizengella axinellae TaxID=3064388 RepID=A0ABT9IXB3_9BACL|nr:glutamate 5-kinase [Chengkuizengella sp. 2205SS18-9]MDP5273883.1 glutamate 5-kinase [Chengkuizengella sp. 2205SS18-9]
MQQRIVVKIGSSSLTTAEGELDYAKIEYFTSEIVQLRKSGYQVLFVSSGSVAAGFKLIGYRNRPKLLQEKQASAAVGQAVLMQAYLKAFEKHGFKTAQILLTRNNFTNRKQMRNAFSTFEELLRQDTIPIINENDTVSVEELKFGDNDSLSALVANLVKAKQLLIFTDTDGLYTADPRKNLNAKKIQRVDEINEDMFRIAGGAGSSVGTGGMRSKIEAARIAMRGGVPVFVGKANEPSDMLQAVKQDGKGTYFDTALHNLPTKKQWLGFHSVPKGIITVDQGAEQALIMGGKSLLPAGVIQISGDFHPGDVIEVTNQSDKVIGRGVVNYASWQLKAVVGMSTNEVKKRIDVNRIEVIHRDEWVTLQLLN